MISGILTYAAQAHGAREIVSKLIDEPAWRYDYAGLARRAAQLAHALKRLGVQPGDRVTSLAWNTHRHLELFYAVPGIGAVLHTANPRSVRRADRLHDQSRGKRRPVLRPQLRGPGRSHRLAADHREHLRDAVGSRTDHPWDRRRHLVRRPDRRRGRDPSLALLRRERRGLPLLHLGHHGRSQGGALFAPRRGAARHGRRPEQRLRLHRLRRGDAVFQPLSRHRLGPAVRRPDLRDQAGPARRQDGRGVAARPDPGRRRHLHRRRADHLDDVPGLAGAERRKPDHAEAGRHWRQRRAARHGRGVQAALRRPGSTDLGHDRDLPDRRRRHPHARPRRLWAKRPWTRRSGPARAGCSSASS
jgi:hypothetical protein